ncbi:MAG: DUF4912 domain-containing protein [Thermodesulfovibrionales bacterium]|nr:DUF4912 domain-containing protein [Thermodesulfovibrionales bacterium]
MTKKELLQKKVAELRSMAKELGLSLPRTAKKEDLALAISKALRLKTLRKKEPLKSKAPKAKVEKAPKRKKKIKIPEKEAVPSPGVELKPVSVEEERPADIFPYKPVITKDLLGLVPVDTQHFYLYWEISRDTFIRVSAEGKFVIRIYDISGDRDISQAPFFELYAMKETGGFHVDMGRPGDFCAEMGIFDKGRFIPLLRSNIIKLPRIPHHRELPEAVRITFPSGIVHPTSL